MKNRLFALLVMVLIGCKKKPESADLQKINGYWEIEKVVFPDGNQKDYAVNEFLDFYTIKNNIGFRQKIKPQLDGSLMQTPLQDNVILKDSANVVYLKTKTFFSKYEDVVLEISDDKLVLENQNKIIYHYKKFVPYAKR